MLAFTQKHQTGRIVYDAKTGEYVAKRTFTCRATYDFNGMKLKCQLHGRHKGIHVHGMARPGAVITVTWDPMVTSNYLKMNDKKPKSAQKLLRELELENNPELMVVA